MKQNKMIEIKFTVKSKIKWIVIIKINLKTIKLKKKFPNLGKKSDLKAK